MRLSSRLIAAAALTVLAGGSAAGCSGNSRATEAGSKRPGVVTASVPPRIWPQAKTASAPSIHVVGAPQGVQAKGGILADAATGQVLWKKDPDTQRPMASITKVMTAYLVIQAGNLNRKIKVPKAVLNYVAKYGASSDGLNPGEVLTAHELLDGLLIESGADAAYTLATTYGPGMSAFIAKMNATARKLGMTHTHFASPDGLPYPTEYSTYSTPADLLTLGLAAMKLPLFRSIVDQPFYHVTKLKGVRHSYWFDNTNELISTYQGAVGIKDGYTDAAKHCLLFEAVRHGVTLIGVVLGSPVTEPFTADQAATRLLDWGFAQKFATSG